MKSLYCDVSTGMQNGVAAKKNGEELLSRPLPGGVVAFLVVELERKLNLPRVVRRVASGANLAECRTVVVT